MKQQFLNDSGLTELIGYIKEYVKDDQDVKPYASLSVFPKTGEQNIIYIDTTVNASYYWDDMSKTYKALDVQTWTNLTGKPSTFPPEDHNHDDRYFTETEMNSKLAGKADSSHTHKKADITDFPTSMPASDVPAWAKASTKPTYTKAEVGLGNVDNTADKDKSVKYATSAGSAGTASSVDWSGVKNPPTTYAPSAHTHGSGDITSLSADKITGVIGIDHLPAGALERCKIVADDTARFKLTKSDIQNGDTVKVGTDANAKMYFVIDDTKLSSEAGYTIYTAGSATSVPWSGVTGKPSTFAPSAHTHDDRYYTESEINSKLAGKSDTGHTHSQYLTSHQDISGKVNNNADGADSLLSKIAAWTATPTDDTYFIRQDTAGTNTFGRVKFSTLWNYIKAKGDSIYAKVAHSHKISEITDIGNASVNYANSAGSAKTATSAGSCTGNAASATALTSSAGSSTQPVYFSGGKPVACSYTINASVPSGAKFTDTNTWRPLGTTADTACAGNDSRLSNARPASDVYAWAKASTKPSYSWSEIGSKPSTFAPSSHTHPWVSNNSANGGTNGYFLIATLKITEAYNNSPIEITISRRGDLIPTRINIVFDNLNSTDPTLNSLRVWGYTSQVWIHKSATSTWNLYTQKTETYDNVGVLSYFKSSNDSGISIAWGNTAVTSLPSGAVQASTASFIGSASYAVSAGNSTKWNGYELDLSTNNTTDTWLLVANNGKIQHRLSTSFAFASHTHSYLPLSGGALTGFVSQTGSGSKDVGYEAKNTDTGASVKFMVGSGKQNKGVYDTNAGNWMIYADQNNKVYVNGNASTATKLTSSAGSNVQPIYFSEGKPVSCSYSLNKSVPSNAVFTDNNTWRPVVNNLTSTSTDQSLSAAQGKILKDKLDKLIPIGYIFIWNNRKLTNFDETLSGAPALTSAQAVHDYFGFGTWQYVGDTFLYGNPNSQGGASTVSLGVGNMPSHTHSIPALSGRAAGDGAHTHNVRAKYTNNCATKSGGSARANGGGNNISDYRFGNTDSQGAHGHNVSTNASTTGSNGSGSAFSIMPPYKGVYIWQRIA